MAEWQRYPGYYETFGFGLTVQLLDGALVAAVPGVPAGYEIPLAPIGPDRFRLENGPLAGALVEFHPAGPGPALFLVCGDYELERLAVADARRLAERLLPPALTLTPGKRAAFSRLFAAVMAQADGRWIDYQLPYPRHEFLRFVTAQDRVIFHGSGRPDIDEFVPLRLSTEIRDRSGRGNLQAVYGTHDALWAMFFAVVDRDRLTGSIRNGVLHFHDRAGRELAVYHFSVNQAQLAERPWRPGTLYWLPRERFRRLPLTAGAMSNEWACETPVRPLARLAVTPADFPFLDRIGGHDDSEVIRVQTLLDAVLAARQSYRTTPDGYIVDLSWNEGLAEQWRQLGELQPVYLPAADFSLTVAADGRTARLALRLPPAMYHVIGQRLARDNVTSEAGE